MKHCFSILLHVVFLTVLVTCVVSCRDDEKAQQLQSGFRYDYTFILIEVEGAGQDVELQDRLLSLCLAPAAVAVLVPTDPGPLFISTELAEAALSDSLLLLLVNLSIHEEFHNTDAMIVNFGSEYEPLAPHTNPPGLEAEMAEYGWKTPEDRHLGLIRIVDKYKPEMVIIKIEVNSDKQLIQAVKPWLQLPVRIPSYVVIVSPQEDILNRGWVLFCGQSITPSRPLGIRPESIMPTVKILAGLDWVPDITSGGIPAVEILPESYLSEALY